jgi:phosphate transport system protein
MDDRPRTDHVNKHISEQFDLELDEARGKLMAMGGLVEQQLRDACHAFFTHDEPLATQVRSRDGRINKMEVELDEHCVHVIARRQPAATDLRTVICVMKASTDLERIGDEAGRIARMAQGVAGLEFPADQYARIRALNAQVSEMLRGALDAFTRMDADSATRVISADHAVDQGYAEIVQEAMAGMQARSDEVTHNMNTIWVARALERIGDHAKNISEDVVYLVEGHDVRHAKDVAGTA